MQTDMVRERFRAWVAEVGHQKGAAVRLECTQGAISFLLAGARKPGLELAHRIQRETADWAEGPILATEWLDAGADFAPGAEPAAEPA
jgi:hypothetical protein